MGASDQPASAKKIEDSAVNDADLGDIMNEINELRTGLADAAESRTPLPHLKSVPASAADTEADRSAETSTPEVEDDELSGASLLDLAIEADAETEAEDSMGESVPSVVKSNDPGGSLSLNLAGSTSLKLKYEYEGQEILIGFADQCLKVTLSDGTEFKIPLGRSKAR